MDLNEVRPQRFRLVRDRIRGLTLLARLGVKGIRVMLRIFLGLLVIALAGCSSKGPVVYHVSGNVTHQGKNIPAGTIYFDPDFSKGNDGTQGFARIKDGRFDTRDGGRGVMPGPHVVRIAGFDGQPKDELPLGTPLFSEYKTPVDLPAENSTQNIDVPKSPRQAGM